MTASDIEKLINEFGTDVYRFCTKLCMQNSDIDDLYQQTFLRLLEINGDINWGDNPKSFLFSITNSVWKNDMRKRARRNRIAPSVYIDDDENIIRGNIDTEEEVLLKIRNENLKMITNELPDKFRVPIILYYTFESSIEEISRIIKKPQGTIKSRLFKGRKLIKKGLEELGYEYI